MAPNFTLRELARLDGSYFIHPNLILTLQNIRSLLGESVRVLQAGEDGAGTRGFCAAITATSISRLKLVCSSLSEDGTIAKLTENGGDVFLQSRRSPVKTLSVEDAIESAFYVTAGFETQGDPFQQVTGNFDGAGLSFGPSQVNFKTRTLVQLFRRFEEIDRQQLQACFTKGTHWDEWRAVCDKPPAQQVIWADHLSDGPKKQFFKQPWRSYLQAVGRVPSFRAEMIAHSKKVYGAKLKTALRWLQMVWPHPITDFRCFCALFDLCTQQGSLDKAHGQIRQRIENEDPSTQTEVVRIAVEERARTADPPWRAACMSRRLGILCGAPARVTENAITAENDNPYFSLLPAMKVQGVQQFLT